MKLLRSIPEMRGHVVANGKHVKNVGCHALGQMAIWQTDKNCFFGLPLGVGAFHNHDLLGPSTSLGELERYWEAC
jgi:hypothetical protein